MKSKLLLGLVIVVCVGLLFWALLGGSSKQTSDKVPYKIGTVSALTGVGAAIGEEERRGAVLATEEINATGGVNGHPLELVSEDLSLDKMKEAVSVARKLIDTDKVKVIVGAQWDEPTQPLLPIIEQAKVPMVGADTSDQLEKDTSYSYFFSVWYDNRVGVRELLRYAKANKLRKIAIVKPVAGGFWEFTASTMIKEAPNYGVEIIAVEDMGNPLSLDFKTPLIKIKSKNPDAIFVVTSDYNQCIFQKQKADLGMNMPSLGTESSGDFVSLKNCPDSLTDRLFSSPTVTNANKDFQERFKQRFGEYPKFPSAVVAYDAVRVIAQALKKTNGEGGEALKNAIQKTQFKGASLDTITFNQKGFVTTPENSFEMMTTKGGQFVKVQP